jgi:hypothetical protein
MRVVVSRVQLCLQPLRSSMKLKGHLRMCVPGSIIRTRSFTEFTAVHKFGMQQK